MLVRKMRESLMLKWMVFSILLATIPLGIAGFTIIEIYQENLKKSVIMIEQEKAHVVVERTRSFFEKIASDLRSLSIAEHLRGGRTSDHLTNHLENLLYQNDYLSELTLLNEKGREIIKVSKYKVFKPSDLKDRSKTEIFQIALNGLTYYGDIKLTDDIVPTMVIGIPIEEYRGRPTGVICAEIHIRYLWNLIPQIQIGEKGVTYVVDHNGNLIAHPDTRRVLSRINVRHLPMVNLAISGKEGNLEFEPSKGETYLVVYKPIKELGWGVIVELPAKEAYEPVRQVTHTALKWILIALCIAILFGFLFTKKLTHPIKRLSDGMAKVSKGDLDVHVARTTKDEVGHLTESFNQMIQDLKHSREALGETEKKYRRIFENSKDMVYITSVEGKLIEVNQAGVEMLGYSSKEELTRVYSKDTYFNPEERKRFLNEIAKEEFVKDFEVKLKRKDGTPIDVLITATVIKNDSGGIFGYEGIIKNITYRKGVEKELFQKTEELQTLYDMSILINQTLDLDRVLLSALEKGLSVTGFEAGAIHLLKEDEEILELKFHIGLSSHLVENIKYLNIGEGIAGKAVQLIKPISLSIDEYSTPSLRPLLKEEGIQTLMSIPLLAKNKGIGALTLVSQSIHHVTQREFNLIQNIGSQIGMALENAKLFSNVVKAKSEWETTFDAVTDLITIRDKDHRIIRANRSAFQRYGMDPRKMIGKKCYDVLHHRETPCKECYISKTLITKKPVSGERKSNYLNGFFRYYTFPIYDEAGEVVAVVDLAREITEEMRLEMEKEVINNINKTLASSLDIRQVTKTIHAELNKIMKSERMTIALLDEERKGFRYFALDKDYETETLAEGVIYPKEGTAIGKAVDTGRPIIIRDITKTDSWIKQELLKEDLRSSLIIPLEYKGKTIGSLNLSSKHIDHFSEEHVRFLRQVIAGLAISIENALLLDEIKASEEKYRTVVEGALDGVCVVGEHYQLKYVNERFAEISGYTKEELIVMDFRNLLDEEGKRVVADQEARRLRGEEVSPHFEINALQKDGEIKHLEISATVMKTSKGNLNKIAFIKDITEKKRMEEQLLQAEKLRALGELASGVAHDFNNALTVILGNAQLMLFTIQDEELKDTLRTIEKVAKDSAQTVRRLQDFTRKGARKELFKLDINSLVQDAINITKPKWKDEAQGRGIDINMVSCLEEIPSVEGVASEIREVFANMIFNAVEAMPKGGKIEIQTFQRKEKVYIQISDTGIGMMEEIRKRIFEPFFTTKPFNNTGLGLSMSYGVINRIGGEINVQSHFGKGTTFTIMLPGGTKEKEEVPSSAMVQTGKEGRILIIDDEESVRNILSKIFSQVNHQVSVAKDGEEGIRLFKEKEFDIVLTDLGMPGMSGWEVCKMIKGISPHLPVGMITGWGMELDQERIEETGIDFVIPKPFDFNQILKRVADTIELKEKRFLS